MSKKTKLTALALAPLCMVLALFNCNSQHPSEIPLGVEIAVEVSPPVGEDRTVDEFYIGETVEVCISVLEPAGLDSLRIRYAMRPVGRASVAPAAPGDSVLTSGAIMEDNCFSVSFATPCTATVYGYARGEAGSVCDSVTIHVVERPDENVAPTLVAEVIRAHCTPEDPCSVSLVVGNEEPWQTIVLSAEPMPAGAEFYGDSLFVWRPGVDDIAGTREFVVRVTDNGNPPRLAADTVAVSVVDASQEDVYYLTYSGNGATGGAVPIDNNAYNANEEATVKGDSSLVREGYTFANWNTTGDGSGTAYEPGDTLAMSGADVTLYAQWVSVPTYLVVYDDNGAGAGTAPDDTQEYRQGEEVTVRGNTGGLVKDGYTFAGWNTAVDGSGVDYAADATFTMAAGNATLYARWTQKPTYSVLYDGNGNTGGTVPTDNSNYEQGATVTVKGNTGDMVKDGYTFAGWNTSADGSGTDYAADATLAMGAENITLYARWTQKPTYSVLYDGNGNTGGTVPTDNSNYEQGATVTVRGNTGDLVKDGYTFAGWNTSADGSATSYAADETFAMDNTNVTLYARWTQNPTYTVTYYGNGNTGGAVPDDENKYEQGATVTVKGNTGNLTRSGHRFAGWNTAANGSGTPYGGGESLSMGAENVSLHAQWTAVYTVRYNGNGNTGGSVPASPQSYAPGTKVTVLSNLGGLRRTGYTFNDWNTDPHGHGADYASEQTFTMGSNNVILYAQWEMNPPVINSHPSDNAVHVGESVTFSVTATGPSLEYQWHKDGKLIAGATSSTYTILSAKVPDDGEYHCMVSNDAGTRDSRAAILVVDCTSGMVLVPAKGKNFEMGSTNGYDDQEPVHTVSFTRDFWMDRTEVTQKQYTEIMSATYAGFSAPAWSSDYGVGDNHPAYYVNWYDAVLYCNARSRKAGLDTVYTYTSISGTPGNDCGLGGLGIDLSKSGFRLPTEAEWEYACRAGTTGDYYWGSGTIGDYAWYTDNSGSKTHTVAGKTANGYGLYDMSGNVWEWCNDWYGSYASGSQTDPEGPTGGSNRVLRGGSWRNDASNLRSANRLSSDPANAHYSFGFRVALPAQ